MVKEVRRCCEQSLRTFQYAIQPGISSQREQQWCRIDICVAVAGAVAQHTAQCGRELMLSLLSEDSLLRLKSIKSIFFGQVNGRRIGHSIFAEHGGKKAVRNILDMPTSSGLFYLDSRTQFLSDCQRISGRSRCWELPMIFGSRLPARSFC